DRLQYDFEGDGLGRNLVDNRSLLGVAGTAPFKWNGHNTSLYMQCGIRFARFLTRSEPFPFDDQVALAAFLQSLRPPRNRHLAPAAPPRKPPPGPGGAPPGPKKGGPRVLLPPPRRGGRADRLDRRVHPLPLGGALHRPPESRRRVGLPARHRASVRHAAPQQH